MYTKYKASGFTLIELLFVLVIVVLLMTMVPEFQQRTPRYERQQFVARINALTQQAWQQAVITHKIHKVAFDFDKQQASIEVATDKKEKDGFPIFERRTGRYLSSSFGWPAHIEIRQFLVEHFDEMQRFGGGRKTGSVWFFIMPEGLTQEVTINFVDKKDTVAGRARQVGLVLNPFSAQFKEYDTFQK